MRLVTACLLASLLAACGSSDDPPPEPETSAAPPQTATEQSAVPPDEPPITEEGGPPPAWLEAPSGSAWMSYGRYCWGDVCVESIQVTCEDSSVPQLDLAPGDAIRFHLEFVPSTAELTLGADGSRPEVVTLEPARVMEWQGDYDGALWLAVTADEGEVAYQACARAVS
jgi:hypothetical protein